MILTTLPDLPPRPETAANAEFRRRFYARWGSENAVVCGQAARQYAVLPQALSIKVAQHGRERYFLARREVVVDDDNYLVLNEGARYGSLLQGLPQRAGIAPAWTFSIFFRPGMQGEVAAQRGRSLAAALDEPDAAPAPALYPFSEHLRRRGDRVNGQLQAIAAAVSEGERDEAWLEERLTCLLGTLLSTEEAGRAAAAPARRDGRCGTRHAAQQDELHRRLREAADFIESHYTEPLSIARLAAVACLSPYHFVREFGRVCGLTPHAWLTHKRAREARRRLAAGEADAECVALQCGFGSRWSMQRALARHAPPLPPS